MDPIEVLVVARSDVVVCASCANGRTWKDVADSLARQLERNFGDAVACRFVDYQNANTYEILKKVPNESHGRLQMPLVFIGGRLCFNGIFSPTFIRREIQIQLEQKTIKPTTTGNKSKEAVTWTPFGIPSFQRQDRSRPERPL